MKSTGIYFLNKKLGETPLECIERFRAERIAQGEPFVDVPLTYAGRLDPMAEGLLICLAGEECKQKDTYLGLDKVYETEFLLGVETDTHDVLGLVVGDKGGMSETGRGNQGPLSEDVIKKALKEFVGERMQTYPAYSSKPHLGKPLFMHARAHGARGHAGIESAILKADMPKREVEIYSIEFLGSTPPLAGLEGLHGLDNLEQEIVRRIGLVKGDFRQDEIVARWRQFFLSVPPHCVQKISLRVHCSSGTYIRALAHELGQKLVKDRGEPWGIRGVGAIAFSIKRTRIGNFILS